MTYTFITFVCVIDLIDFNRFMKFVWFPFCKCIRNLTVVVPTPKKSIGLQKDYVIKDGGFAFRII